MKKLLTIALLLVFSVSVNAQTEVTKFLGIPVDGNKIAMIQKLRAKGFRSIANSQGTLEGEFNGTQVLLSVVTNNNKVWRIVVADATSRDEANIKIRFNTLCRQFENNSKYLSLEDQTLADDEDISYEQMVHKKQYQELFFQKGTGTEEVFDNGIQNRLVWFEIHKDGYDKYSILMFYDNEYNHANGEDL